MNACSADEFAGTTLHTALIFEGSSSSLHQTSATVDAGAPSNGEGRTESADDHGGNEVNSDLTQIKRGQPHGAIVLIGGHARTFLCTFRNLERRLLKPLQAGGADLYMYLKTEAEGPKRQSHWNFWYPHQNASSLLATASSYSNLVGATIVESDNCNETCALARVRCRKRFTMFFRFDRFVARAVRQNMVYDFLGRELLRLEDQRGADYEFVVFARPDIELKWSIHHYTFYLNISASNSSSSPPDPLIQKSNAANSSSLPSHPLIQIAPSPSYMYPRKPSQFNDTQRTWNMVGRLGAGKFKCQKNSGLQDRMRLMTREAANKFLFGQLDYMETCSLGTSKRIGDHPELVQHVVGDGGCFKGAEITRACNLPEYATPLQRDEIRAAKEEYDQRRGVHGGENVSHAAEAQRGQAPTQPDQSTNTERLAAAPKKAA